MKISRKWSFLPFSDPKTPQNGHSRPGISLFRAKNTYPIRPEAIRSTSAHHTWILGEKRSKKFSGPHRRSYNPFIHSLLGERWCLHHGVGVAGGATTTQGVTPTVAPWAPPHETNNRPPIPMTAAGEKRAAKRPRGTRIRLLRLAAIGNPTCSEPRLGFATLFPRT